MVPPIYLHVQGVYFVYEKGVFVAGAYALGKPQPPCVNPKNYFVL